MSRRPIATIGGRAGRARSRRARRSAARSARGAPRTSVRGSSAAGGDEAAPTAISRKRIGAASGLARALVPDERVRPAVLLVGLMLLAPDLAPLRRVELGEERVALEVGVDPGQDHPVSDAEKHPEDLLPAADHDLLAVTAGDRERLIRSADDDASVGPVGGLPSEDDVGAVRQRSLEGLERTPPHDQRMPDGGLFEVTEIGGKAPGARK